MFPHSVSITTASSAPAPSHLSRTTIGPSFLFKGRGFKNAPSVRSILPPFSSRPSSAQSQSVHQRQQGSMANYLQSEWVERGGPSTAGGGGGVGFRNVSNPDVTRKYSIQELVDIMTGEVPIPEPNMFLSGPLKARYDTEQRKARKGCQKEKRVRITIPEVGSTGCFTISAAEDGDENKSTTTATGATPLTDISNTTSWKSNCKNFGGVGTGSVVTSTNSTSTKSTDSASVLKRPKRRIFRDTGDELSQGPSPREKKSYFGDLDSDDEELESLFNEVTASQNGRQEMQVSTMSSCEPLIQGQQMQMSAMSTLSSSQPLIQSVQNIFLPKKGVPARPSSHGLFKVPEARPKKFRKRRHVDKAVSQPPPAIPEVIQEAILLSQERPSSARPSTGSSSVPQSPSKWPNFIDEFSI